MAISLRRPGEGGIGQGLSTPATTASAAGDWLLKETASGLRSSTKRIELARHCMGVRTDAGVSAAAIEAIYRSQFTRFLRLGYALLGNQEQARDAVQETFATALRSRGSFRGDGSLEGWLWTTMLNVCRQEQRRRRRFTDGVLPEPSTNGHSDEWRELRALVAALPEQERHAVFLRYYAELSQDETAEVLGVRPGTVGAALNHARNKLRTALRPEVAS